MEDLAAARRKALKRFLFMGGTLAVLSVALFVVSLGGSRKPPRLQLRFVNFSHDTNGLLTAILQLTNSGTADLWLVPIVSVDYSLGPRIPSNQHIKGGMLKSGSATNIVITPAAGLKFQTTIRAHQMWRIQIANKLALAKFPSSVLSSIGLYRLLGSDQITVRTGWIEAPLLPQAADPVRF